MTASRIIIDPDSLPAEGRGWTLAMGGLLVALLAFLPAAFGAVEAWSEFVAALLSAALSLCLAIWFMLRRNVRPIGVWPWLPLLLFVLLVAFQQMAWPTAVVRGLSPATVATRQELLGDSSLAGGQSTISFYPLATAHGLRMLLIGVTCFAVAANVFVNSRQIKILLTAIFAIGCAEAVLALAQIATGADKIYWTVNTTPGGRVTSGSFVNYSHFSQFMNLSLGAGIALLVMRLHEQRRAEMRGQFGRLVSYFDWETYGWLIVGMIVSAMAVLTSMSRNGAISLVLAAAVIGTALYRRGSLSGRGWLLGLLPLGVLAGLLIFGFDALYARLATLHSSTDFEGRWDLTLATLRVWRTFPIWGTGLGTHEYVFPMFDSAASAYLPAHADNDYAELLEEMGVFGMACVALFLAWVGLRIYRLMFSGRSPLSTAAFGIGFALLAVAIHSATDFGQHVPANFCLAAVYCGLLVAIANVDSSTSPKQSPHGLSGQTRWFTGRRAAALAVAIGLVAFWCWDLKDAYTAYLGERWWAAALEIQNRLQHGNRPVMDQDYVDLIAAADAATKNEPRNVKYGFWLNEFRWQSLSRVTDPDTGEVVLHPDVVPFVARIANELSQVRQICPTYGPPWALEGELRLFVLKQPIGGDLVRQAVRLASYDPSTCLVAGELAARTGRVEDAQSMLNRAVKLNPASYREVIGVYLFDLHRPDLAKSLASSDYERLAILTSICAGSKEYTELVGELSVAAEQSLRQRASTEDAKPEELATLAAVDFSRRDFASAAELYRRALNQDYKRVEWHLQLARALKELGQFDAAEHEVRICLRLHPRDQAADALLDELTVRAKSPNP